MTPIALQGNLTNHCWPEQPHEDDDALFFVDWGNTFSNILLFA